MKNRAAEQQSSRAAEQQSSRAAVKKALLHYCAVFLTSYFLLLTSLYGSTLSTNFARVSIDNLKIGGSYNLTEVANFPMWVRWGGGGKVRVTIEPVRPSRDDLVAGYEIIPDPAWISVSKKEFELLPDELQNLDVTVSVPNDPIHLGKKYQAYLHVTAHPPADSGGGVHLALAVKGKILAGIAPKAPTEEDLAEMRRLRARARQGVMITPERFEVDVPSARRGRINVTEYEPLKIINPSTENIAITIEAVGPEISGISAPRDYLPGSPADVRVSRARFALRPDMIENVKIWVDRPAPEGINRGRRDAGDEKKFYVLKIGIKSDTIEVARFVRIYIGGEE